MTRSPYNPLEKRNLGKSIAEALLASPVHSLPPGSFAGAGIYSLYYVGSYPLYSALKKRNLEENFSSPIYVGKAIPEGARKAGVGSEASTKKVLYDRLSNHAKTISQCSDLKVEDFRCRYLTVDDIWIPLGESLLIQMSAPIWNMLIDGFGNNDPGSKRYDGAISAWDLLHPGRKWASKMRGKNSKTIEQFSQEIKNFLKKPRPSNTTRITVPEES